MKVSPVHEIDHIETNIKLAPLYDAYKGQHERFLSSDMNSASKTNLEIMIDVKN